MICIPVALVEDDRRLRVQLAELIDATDGFRCVGDFASGEDALSGVPGLMPAVVLMDINLPGMSGIECVRRLRDEVPDIQVIMLTVSDDHDHIFKALEMGATGYLLKHAPAEEMFRAIREVREGGAPMSGYIARKVVQSFQRPAGGLAGDSLTPREEEILQYVAKGYINKEIAAELGIGLETVRSHLKRVYEKLHVRSRTEAVVKGLRP